MKGFLIVSILMLLYSNSIAQKSKYIYGIWKLKKVETDSIVFDFTDTATSFNNYYAYQKRISKKIFTIEDSLMVRNYFSKLSTDYSKYFFQFNKDGIFKTNKFRGGSKITDDTISGNFYLKNKYVFLEEDKKKKMSLKILTLNKSDLVIRINLLTRRIILQSICITKRNRLSNHLKFLNKP